MNHAHKIMMPWLLLVLLAGCSSPASMPENRYYDFSQLQLSEQKLEARYENIVVQPLASDQLRQQSNMVYSKDGQRFGSYHYHLWADSPTRLLSRVLMQQLLESSVTHQVSDRPLRGLENAYLNGVLHRFDRVSIEGDWYVVVELELALSPRRGAAAEYSAKYRRQIMASDQGILASHKAFIDAVEEILVEFTRDLAR